MSSTVAPGMRMTAGVLTAMRSTLDASDTDLERFRATGKREIASDSLVGISADICSN